MAYSPLTWIDEETPVNANNMNHIETGIKAVEESCDIDASIISLFSADGWEQEQD